MVSKSTELLSVSFRCHESRVILYGNAGNSQRILEWFGNFASAAGSEHRKGAKALTQFAFVNRDICWDELEWKGRHGQSPAIVATKPHYFFDLDVVRTVENFLENVPEFWSSDELADSVEFGDILAVDTKFFVDCFVRMMYEDNFEDVWTAISEFLMEEQFSYLCGRILILLDECELHNFLISLRKVICSSLPGSYDLDISFWLEILLLESNGCPSIDELLVTNSAIRHGRQLIRLLDDEEHEDIKENIGKLTLNNDHAQTDVSISAFMKDCLNMNKAAAIKWFSLQSWFFHYYLFKKCRTVEQWESLLHENGVHFRKSKNFFSANHGGLSEVTDHDLDEDDLHRSGKKSKSRKRKRKKYPNRDLSTDAVLLEMDASSGGQNLKAGGISWFLSTDGFSCSRDSVCFYSIEILFLSTF